jgi:hypothetical protein
MQEIAHETVEKINRCKIELFCAFVNLMNLRMEYFKESYEIKGMIEVANNNIDN